MFGADPAIGQCSMKSQLTQPPYATQLPLARVSSGALKASAAVQSPTIDTDMAMTDTDRTQRAASVLSGMSAEDMEAAETLNSLHASTCPKTWSGSGS